jgi:hypothetical protein
VEPSVSSKKTYNFLINASNQANLASSSNMSAIQLNSILVFINPYELEKLNFEDLDINIQVDEKGIIKVNDLPVEPIEIKPGIRILGIAKKV